MKQAFVPGEMAHLMSDPKPVHTLSADDLTRHPIWTYATDSEGDHDETYVRPVNGSQIPADEDHAVYHVACDIATSTGARHIGFVSICNGQYAGEAPTVVGAAGEYWPLDELPLRRSRAQFDAFFGVQYEALIPVEWTMRALIHGEKRCLTGVYAGPEKSPERTRGE